MDLVISRLEPQEIIGHLTSVPAPAMTFWSGAGISGDPPTQGPLGLTLTYRALAHAFDDQLLGLLQAAYDDLGLDRAAPRLEAILEVARLEHGPGVLEALLHDLTDAPSNPNHVFFSHHLQRGGQHVTANFDTCIERAEQMPVEVVHFHGSLNPHGAVDDLGARLSRIEHGFDDLLTARLDEVLKRTKVLVVVGYSGLDYFDVDPYWRDATRRGLMRHLRILWVNHANTWDAEVVTGDACGRKQLRVAAEVGGAEVYEVQAPTREVLDMIAGQLGMDALTAPPSWVDRPEQVAPLEATRRHRATTRFLSAAGLHHHVVQRVEQSSDDDPEALSWAAEAAWASGRYRIASWLWTRANAGAANAAVRLERQAACRWLRGQLRAARKDLTTLMCHPATLRAGPVQQLIVAETLGRVLVHMRRLPDTRMLVRQRHVQQVTTVLDRAAAEVAGQLPIHLRVRVASVREDLTGVRNLELSAGEGSPERGFDEYEALSAMVNYEHRRLRDRATNVSGADGYPEPWEYQRLRAHHHSVGATADAARVPLLPGGATNFGVTEVVAGFLQCDFTWWHTARLVAIHIGQRCHQHLRQHR